MATRLRHDLAVGFRIARGELQHKLRSSLRTRREKAILGLATLVLLPGCLFVIREAYFLGVASRDGVGFPVLEVARNGLAPSLLLLVVLSGLGAAQSLADQSVRPLLLTSASTRAIVAGKVLTLVATWSFPLVLGIAVAFAYVVGARTPLFLVSILVAALPLVVLTMMVGLSIAYLLWLGVERLGLPERTRRLVTTALSLVTISVAMLAGFAAGGVTGSGDVLEMLPTGEPTIPLGWYADLLFLGSPVAEPIGLRSVLVAGFVLVSIPLAFAGLVRLAPLFWYATPTLEADDGEDESAPITFDRKPSESVGRIPGTLRNRLQTVRIATDYLTMAIRRPDSYVYLFYYLFPLIILAPIALTAPAVAMTLVGGSLFVLGVWLAGSCFCLNPLGTEGSMLSQVVLAPTPAQTFVHARALAGLTVGIPLATVGLVLVVVSPPVASVATALLVALGLALGVGVVLTSGCLALGIGSVVPTFETIKVFDSVETLAPSIIAAVIHGALTLALGIGAALVTLAVGWPDSPLSLLERLGLLALFLVGLTALADGSRRYAIARLRDYGLERPRVDRPFVIYTAFAIGLLAFVLGQLIVVSAVVLVGIDVPLIVLLPVLFVFEYGGYAVAAAGFLYVTRRGWQYLDLAWPTPREVGFVLGGLVGSVALWAIASVTIAELGLPAGEHILFDPGETGDPRLLVTIILLMLFVNGPLEELLYRNVIQKYVNERFSTATAIGVGSVVFALAHIPAYATGPLPALVVTLVLLFVISCFWGAIYAHTRSLFVVAAIHGLYNATLVGFVLVSL